MSSATSFSRVLIFALSLAGSSAGGAGAAGLDGAGAGAGLTSAFLSWGLASGFLSWGLASGFFSCALLSVFLTSLFSGFFCAYADPGSAIMASMPVAASRTNAMRGKESRDALRVMMVELLEPAPAQCESII